LLTHPTLDQLNQLGLFGMAKAFAELQATGDAAQLSHPDWLGLLIESELSHRRDKRLATRLRYAKLRHNAVVEDIDYRTQRGLDRSRLQRLIDGSWIDAHDNLILTGPTGVGKSWLASALFRELALARGDGRYARLLRSLLNPQLLILDDWGLEPLDAGARRDLLEIFEERYGRRSTIITSQIPVDRWHEVINDPTYADAILDRIVHNAHRLELAGESLRRVRSKQPQKD
jgi:DNA replication protein DnaC